MSRRRPHRKIVCRLYLVALMIYGDFPFSCAYDLRRNHG